MTLSARLQRLIPTREQLQAGRFTRWLAPWLGQRRLWRLSRHGVALGMAIGIFFGLPGLVAGPFLGAALGEVAHGREWKHASKIGFGTWMGLLLGAIFKLGLAFAMLGLFGLALLVD